MSNKIYIRRSKSSFNGIIDEIPDISADNFDNMNKRGYFLSHCHKDHTEGLFSVTLLDNLQKNNAYIYTSEPSAAIINHENQHEHLMKYIKPLKLGNTLITIPANSENDKDVYINVTLIPAGHCFGSVMFLFRTHNKTILYTGDFRMSPNNITKFAHFHDDQRDPIHIETMYIDTTFQGYQHENFPKRSESIENIVSDIKNWLDSDASNRIALHTSANYGYEYVFNEIYKKLGLKVYVCNNKWLLYSQYPDQISGVTNDESETRIHLCKNRNEHNESHIGCIPHDTYGTYLYIHFSAMKWQDYQIDEPTLNKTVKRIDVCFATHCSRSELVYFINYFSPKKIVGFPDPYHPFTPNKFVCENEVTPIKRKLGVESKSSEKKSVKIVRKVDSSLLRKIFD